jgi:hypothetical protein
LTPICSGITGGDGKLTGNWRDLFNHYSDRFLLGSDTRNIADGSRSFIANGNVLRLFETRVRD